MKNNLLSIMGLILYTGSIFLIGYDVGKKKQQEEDKESIKKFNKIY